MDEYLTIKLGCQVTLYDIDKQLSFELSCQVHFVLYVSAVTL